MKRFRPYRSPFRSHLQPFSRYQIKAHLRGDGYGPGQHAAESVAFYPSVFASQRWFKCEGRSRRVDGWMRIGGQVYF